MPNFLDRLTIPEESGLDPTMLVPLLRLLAAGEPVTVEALAAAVGLPVDEVTRRLAAVPDTEYDEQGRIVGQGLTLRPTRHRFTVAGQELYTWCALDTLIFPTILDRPASIESESPVSGHPIRVSVGENGVTSVQPETAVVSLVNPDDLTSIRSSFCNQVHYFTCAQDAAPWLAEHPEGQIVSVAEAHQLGAALTTQILAAPYPASCPPRLLQLTSRTQPDEEKSMNQRPRRNPVLLGAAAVLVTALCCAAPVLIAGGALAAVCGLLENPWVIGAAVALLLAAVVAFARRGQRGDHCCPADSHSPATHTLDDLTKGSIDNV